MIACFNCNPKITALQPCTKIMRQSSPRPKINVVIMSKDCSGYSYQNAAGRYATSAPRRSIDKRTLSANDATHELVKFVFLSILYLDVIWPFS